MQRKGLSKFFHPVKTFIKFSIKPVAIRFARGEYDSPGKEAKMFQGQSLQRFWSLFSPCKTDLQFTKSKFLKPQKGNENLLFPVNFPFAHTWAASKEGIQPNLILSLAQTATHLGPNPQPFQAPSLSSKPQCVQISLSQNQFQLHPNFKFRSNYQIPKLSKCRKIFNAMHTFFRQSAHFCLL